MILSSSTTVEAALRQAAGRLASHSTSPALDAELLLGAVLGIGRPALITRAAEPLAAPAFDAYQALIEERLGGVPVAYLTGRREFWSLALMVTPAVLVPRPESEVLVETALTVLPRMQARSVLDLGTGSGAIALAIASERPRARVTGVDVSPAALGVARENARALGLPEVTWRLGSWFDAVPGERFDVVVANPPYVADGDPALAALAAEPALALCAGPEGLDAIAAIIEHAPSHLEPGGWLMLEHGSTQYREVARALERRGFRDIRCHDDYSGLPRLTRGSIHPLHQEYP